MRPVPARRGQLVKATATAAHELKQALYEVAQTLYDSDKVCVSFGHPGDRRDLLDILAFTELRTEQDPATLGTNRTRNEYVYLTVNISSFRAGEADDDAVPSASAYEILRVLETYLRVTDTTIGGNCQWCFLESTNAGGITDRAMLTRGRLIQIEAEFKAFVRITN